MKNGKTLTLNTQGMVLFGIIIFVLIFALGYTSNKGKQGLNETVFTRDDLDRIVELQAIEDRKESGAEICAYKDENGKLMIAWK